MNTATTAFVYIIVFIMALSVLMLVMAIKSKETMRPFELSNIVPGRKKNNSEPDMTSVEVFENFINLSERDLRVDKHTVVADSKNKS